MILRQILIILISLSLLSGCADGIKGYFKRSSNNKLIDTKSFQKSKRRPLYNKRYIAMAKSKVITDDLEEDEGTNEDELVSTPKASKLNRQMYMDMVKQDDKKFRAQKNNGKYEAQDYPSLEQSNNKTKFNKSDEENLKKELEEIKSMLNDTKRELAKNRCPLQKQPETLQKKPKLKEKFTGSNIQEEIKKLPPPSSI